MLSEIAALTRLCKQWGGDLRLVSPQEFTKIFPVPGQPGWDGWGQRSYYHAPFADNIGLNWKRKIVYGPLRESDWPMLIHEMAHVFASPVNPGRSDEYHFTGWEIAVARLIDCNMSNWEYINRRYQLGDDGEEIGSISPRTRERLYAKCLDETRLAGLLNSRFEPMAIR